MIKMTVCILSVCCVPFVSNAAGYVGEDFMEKFQEDMVQAGRKIAAIGEDGTKVEIDCLEEHWKGYLAAIEEGKLSEGLGKEIALSDIVASSSNEDLTEVRVAWVQVVQGVRGASGLDQIGAEEKQKLRDVEVVRLLRDVEARLQLLPKHRKSLESGIEKKDSEMQELKLLKESVCKGKSDFYLACQQSSKHADERVKESFVLADQTMAKAHTRIDDMLGIQSRLYSSLMQALEKQSNAETLLLYIKIVMNRCENL